MACLLFIYFISPLCGVAQTPDCGMFVIYLPYKPFMWCRSDARLWHACYLLFNPFMWCRSDVRLRHARYLQSFQDVASDIRSVHFITILSLPIPVAYK